MRELARQSLGLELGRERGIESDDETRLARDRVTGLALMRDEHLRRLQLEPLDDDEPVASLVPPLRERRSDLRQILSEPRSQHLEVRLHDLAHESLGAVAHLEPLHVELVAHDRRELVVTGQRAPIAVALVEHRDELRQRRAHLRLGLRARGAPELDDAARGAHSTLEIVIDELLVRGRVSRVMHRRGRFRDCVPHEVLVHRLRDERHDRREEPHERDERVIERLVRRERIAARSRLPEARAITAHIPR